MCQYNPLNDFQSLASVQGQFLDFEEGEKQWRKAYYFFLNKSQKLLLSKESKMFF